MANYLSAVPAYGRDYNSKREVMLDWAAGKDFLVQGISGSGYINKDGAPSGSVINIRYKKLTLVCPITIK